MINRGRSILLAVVILIASCRGGHAAAASPSTVESLSFETTGAVVIMQVRVSGPPPRYTCTIGDKGTADVLVDLPDVKSDLDRSYRPGLPLVREARVEPLGNGIRIRIVLGQSRLAGIEQVEKGLALRFVSATVSAEAGPGVDYRIGIGDKIDIGVFGHEDLTRTSEVQEDGTVNVPLIGNVAVSGKTTAQVDDEVTAILGRDFLVDPEVSVAVREYKSRWVTIIGEVRTPGRYELKRNMRLIDLFAEAGGATKEAGTRITVTRQDAAGGAPVRLVLDRERLLRGNEEKDNLVLAHGDIITLAEQDVYYIRGEVSKPGPYYLSGSMTVLKAIGMAGGLTPFANRRAIEVLRAGDAGVSEKVVLNLKAIEDGKKKDVPLGPNDIVIVPRRIF